MRYSKKLFFLIAISLPSLFSACVPKDKCRISIEAKNYPSDIIRLVWYVDSEMQEDSIPLKNGKGTIDIQCPEWTEILLINKDESKSITVENGIIPAPMFQFFIENGKKVSIQFDNNEWPAISISGGKLNNDYMRLWKETGKLHYKSFELRREIIATNDTDIQQTKNEEWNTVQKEIKEKEKHFIQTSSDSYVSLCLLTANFSSTPVLEFESQFIALNKEIQNTEKGQLTYTHILNAKRTLPGQPAPEFSAKDKDGNIIQLSDFKGKYVLIDFWGTWCIPCRKSHPHLVGLYEKYAPKGVEFISISHEWGNNPREMWLKAIDDDGLVWIQILNNEEQQLSNVVDLYSIRAFPTKVLIDKDGKIIDKYVGDSEMIDEKLKEIFN